MTLGVCGPEIYNRKSGDCDVAVNGELCHFILQYERQSRVRSKFAMCFSTLGFIGIKYSFKLNFCIRRYNFFFWVEVLHVGGGAFPQWHRCYGFIFSL